MIDSLISAIATVLSWIIGIISDIAYFFSRVAYYAGQIPGVGSSLRAGFTSIQASFNDFGYDVAHFSTRLQNVLNAIDNWLDDLADLWNDVHGWVMDRVDDAYYRARDAWDWIVDTGRDLADDLYGWIMDRIDTAYTRARNAFYWVIDEGEQLWSDLYGWISDKLNDAYVMATDAWDWIVANAAKLEEIPALIRSEVLQIVGPVFNLVEYWFEDISLFFSDPPAYFEKKLEQLGAPFAERLWAIVEKVLERIW